MVVDLLYKKFMVYGNNVVKWHLWSPILIDTTEKDIDYLKRSSRNILMQTSHTKVLQTDGFNLDGMLGDI